MFPIAKRSYICNLGQIGQNVTKLSIKASMKMMKLKELAREQGSLCGFLGMSFELSKARLEHEKHQLKQEEHEIKNAHF